MRICTLIILTALAGGCCACKAPVSDHVHTPGGPQPYIISIGSGGGVTGMTGGMLIDTTGEVTSWQSMLRGDTQSEPVGRMSQAQLRLLYAIIEEDQLMDFNHNTVGNMTAFLTLKGGGNNHSIRWEGTESSVEDAPPPVRRFIQALNTSYEQMERTGGSDK